MIRPALGWGSPETHLHGSRALGCSVAGDSFVWKLKAHVPRYLHPSVLKKWE